MERCFYLEKNPVYPKTLKMKFIDVKVYNCAKFLSRSPCPTVRQNPTSKHVEKKSKTSRSQKSHRHITVEISRDIYIY